MVFSVLVVISIAFFYYGYKYADKKSLGIIMFFVFSAIAVLTKGLLGLCFPLGTVLIFLSLKRDLKFLACKATLWGFLLFLLTAAPWHIHMYNLYGQKFVDHYWHNVHVRRLFVAEHKRLDNWYFYIMLMFAGIMPWTFFSLSALGKLVREVRLNEYGRRDQFLFLLSWIISIYIFIQPAHSKLASYVFPAFPAIIMIISYYIGHSIDKTEGVTGNSLKAIGTALSVAMVIGIGVGLYFAKRHIDIVVSMTPVYIASALVFVAAVNIFMSIRRGNKTHMVWSVASISAILLVTMFLGKPYTEPWVSCKAISDEFKKMDQSDSVVLSSKFYVRGVRFYTDRKMAVIDLNGKGFFTSHPIPFLNTDKKIKDFLKSQAVTWCIIRDQDIIIIERIMLGSGYTVTKYQDIGGKYIVKVAKI
jgi:4-amino-4-deoxy-L-arabinose transferase-like glycosyltransferase